MNPLILFLMLQAAAPAASPTFWLDGDGLAKTCAEGVDDLELGSCIGYINGASDQSTIDQPLLGKHLYCPPASLSKGALRAAVLQFIAAEAPPRRLPASLYVAKALAQAFPCSPPSP